MIPVIPLGLFSLAKLTNDINPKTIEGGLARFAKNPTGEGLVTQGLIYHGAINPIEGKLFNRERL